MKKDILVIGAGITGVSAAIALKKKGLSVLLVERDKTARERFRGEYLQPYAVKGLEALGLGSIFETSQATQVKELRFRDLNFGSNNVGADILISYPKGSVARVVPNKVLVEGLRKIAREQLGENFHEGATLLPTNSADSDFFDNPRFSLKKSDGSSDTISPRFVIGADGRQSTVREWMKGPKAPANGAPMLGAKPEFMIGCELHQSAITPERYEVIRTQGRGTLSFFQLEENRQRVYWNTPASGPANKDHWERELTSLLERVKPHIGFESVKIDHLAGAPANTKWMGPAAMGAFFLAGDALAITTPLGGQGMTCSRHHVEALLRLLDSGPVDLDQIGKLYDTSAKKWYQHVNTLNLGLYYLFFANSALFKLSTRHILKTWNEHHEMAERIGRLFGGDDLDTPSVQEITRLWGISGHLQKHIPKFHLPSGIFQ